jgi:synaptobrevin family protein YKT6
LSFVCIRNTCTFEVSLLQVILHKTIDEILVRGERLDDLVDRTADLSSQSKQFYKVAKKHNSCCSLM